MLNTILTILTEVPKQNSATPKDFFLVGILVGWVIFWASKDKKDND